MRSNSYTCMPRNRKHPREARWLAGSCWNAGLARLRAGDKATACRYLQAGLAMTRHLPRWGAPDRAAMERLAAEEAGLPVAAVAVAAAACEAH